MTNAGASERGLRDAGDWRSSKPQKERTKNGAAMKALTVWQPWASLIAAGAKPYEFRSWRLPRHMIGQRIAIHAGSRVMVISELRAIRINLRKEPSNLALRPEIALPLLERLLERKQEAPLLGEDATPALPLSSVICTAVLGESVPANEIMGEFGRRSNDSDRDEHFNFAWPLLSIEPVEPISPARGALGFWNWTP
jgi:hypothetical protein